MSDDNHRGAAPQLFASEMPFDGERIRAAAVYCSDGRFGEQVDDLLHNALGLPRYDRLAVPGGAACLAGHFATFREDEGVGEQLRFLIKTHQVQRVVLIAHQDCAYYTERLRVSPLVLESQQREDLEKAVRRVRRFDRDLQIDTFFARKQRQQIVFERLDV
jgi:hypothetical protein